MTIGTRIAEQRKKRKMTQEDLASTLGVSPQAVSKWEKDINYPDITLLVEMSSLFEVTLDYLVKGDSATVSVREHVDMEKRILRIRAVSEEGDRAVLNLPIPLVKWFMSAGSGFQLGKMNMKDFNLDLDSLMEIIAQGAVGKLVEAESAGGDIVEIFVE